MSEKKVFTVEVPLRWGDMDAYGHVNNVTMVQILEEARIALFGPPPSSGEPSESLPVSPLPFFSYLDDGVQALVADHTIKYRKPLVYRGLPARVELILEKIGAASLTVGYRVYEPVTGDHCVTASTTLAFFNTATGAIVRISAEHRARLQELSRCE